MSLDLRLAAWFLWITPLAAALSIRLMARRIDSSADVDVLGDGGVGLLGAGAQLGPDGLVAGLALDGLAVALDLATDVGHWRSSSSSCVGSGRHACARRPDGLRRVPGIPCRDRTAGDSEG